ncbi:Carboxypeptidase Q [Aphelenchoides besseyi]|nr:Carboxypeptidase Q [Aphelenchoides besseyi]KAI6211394.1 Carboxypeptidase Q [Aphelenchoides besseyi]
MFSIWSLALWPLIVNAAFVEDKFGESVHDLINHITTSSESVNSGYEWLEPLVDDFGNRMLCTKRLEDAIEFTVDRLKSEDQFDNVHTEDVHNLPNWIRGDDHVWLLEPRVQRLNVLAIGGIDPSNVTAEAVVLRDYNEVENVDVRGKIVVYNQPWNSYFDDYIYRRASAKVKEHGAMGLLAKSVGPFSIGSPHTGSGTDDHLPAASLTLEEAEMLDRLVKRNKTLKVNMDIRSKNNGKCSSKNIIFDIKGSELPNEIVLLSGHIDSWDLGQGALDDGGGMAAVWQGMKMLQKLAQKDKRFQPKRTIRGIFWTAEEQGFFGAAAYYEAHMNTSEKFVFVSETDQGAFKPTSNDSIFRFKGNSTHRARLQEIAELLQANGIPISVREAPQQGDVQKWADDGIPSINYVADKGQDFYFNFHHTQGDYLSVFKEGDIDYTAAIMATLGHVIANQDSWL